MMRSASFIILSVSLHAAALVYPLSFGGRSQAQLIHVTILPMEQQGGGSASQRGSGNPTIPRDKKSRRAMPSVIESRIEAKSFVNPAPEVLPSNNVLTASNGSIALVAAIGSSADSFPAAISNSAGDAANVQDVGPGGTGSGLDSSGAGFGQGSGSGTGSGSSGTIGLTQARYRDTPRPEYPDSARREGSEGSVLLRVLVDEQGRSKKIEINSSSGTPALDHAAMQALRRWRFHPARYRDQAVESWLRVPIEFRLADVK
jgi:periplasmic protein TonB